VDFGNIDILIDDDTLPGGRPGGIGDGPDAVNITRFALTAGQSAATGRLPFRSN
jgi:hypothetical protein